MSANFGSLLQKPMDDVKRPVPLPAGTYHGVVAGGQPEFGESKNKKTPFVKYGLILQSAGEDVDTTLLDGIELSKRSASVTYYLTEDALFRLKDFLESVGVSTEGRALGECIPEAMNAKVIIAITQRNSEDGKSIFNDVGDVRGEE